MTEKKIHNPDDICDYGGYFPVAIKIRKFNNKFKTFEFIIFPEVFTEYIMVTENLSYEKASIMMHGKGVSEASGLDIVF